MTEREKNNLVKQYEPLINKITKQFNDKGFKWDIVKSLAYEGFATAMNVYDPSKSNMDFTKFAAFYIRNIILNGLNNELRTVKVSAFIRKKDGDKFNPYNTFSVDEILSLVNSDDRMNHKGQIKDTILNISVEPSEFSNNEKVFCNHLLKHFKKEWCELFFHYYALNGYKELKGYEIAEKYHVTRLTVAIHLKKIVAYIKKHEGIKKLLIEK